VSERLLLRGGIGLALDPPEVGPLDVRVAEGRIAEVGPALAPRPGEAVEDLQGRWLMPGLVLGHTHLYSALATGMPFLPGSADGFTDMLARVWWRLDRALDLDAVEVSALVGGVQALRAGVTTLFDHHASPACIDAALPALDGALGALGLRRALCYEITDRGGTGETAAGLRATERALAEPSHAVGGARTRAVLVGGHAGFTLSDASLRRMGELAAAAGVGVHIHVAEAPDDRRAVGEDPVRRLQRLGCLRPGSVLAHGVHLDADSLRRVADAGAWMTHQPRSNMNNGVGLAPLADFPPDTALGTDGIGADLFAELQCGWWRGQDQGGGAWGMERWRQALAAGNRLAERTFGGRFGRLQPGCVADLAVLDPVPGPPLRALDLAAALVFRFGSGMVRDVMVGGRWALRDRMPVGVRAADVDERARAAAPRLWARMGDAPAVDRTILG
jgi:cytosine/adenosine deaminase-related metal-dependent hydrolase